MRIISGKIGGIRLQPPSKLPVRPTTDLAKEALFNILQNRIDFDHIDCLDLFAGTGNISFELASRGAKSVQAVDIHYNCVKYIKETADKHQLDAIDVKKMDVFRFIAVAKSEYDLVFADPPYDLPSITTLPKVILEAGLLRPGGVLIVEHPSTKKLGEHPFWIETRKYGYSSFSFYSYKSDGVTR